ncbi:hypothetical protein [Arthrobacter sp. QXT-31]|uniref:hypothetical protein n=1 Tax=Arthrobacter sp. QXT-31 TaxID=1357915 RepID=UPI0012F726CC|nr:hypothetical protein [Arthrobacter sp. QXT-31]
MISLEESLRRVRDLEARYAKKMAAQVAADNRFTRMREEEPETVTPLWDLVEK